MLQITPLLAERAVRSSASPRAMSLILYSARTSSNRGVCTILAQAYMPAAWLNAVGLLACYFRDLHFARAGTHRSTNLAAFCTTTHDARV